MAKPSDVRSEASPDHIEQIRDIIVGPQKRENDRRFEQLSADIQREGRVAHERLQQESARLRELYERGLASLQADIATKFEAQTEANASLRKQQGEAETRLRSETRRMLEELSREFEMRMASLGDTSVSREVLAELLQELVMKLQGVQSMDELAKAARR